MISLRGRIKELELANRKLSDRWLLAVQDNVKLRKQVECFQKRGVKS